MQEVSYERYQELGGQAAEDVYNASINHALAAVREQIWPNQPSDELQKLAWEMAVYAAVDVDAAYGSDGGIGSGLNSLSIGAFSESYGSGNTSAANVYDEDMRRAIVRELAGTGLLYRGVQ